MILEEDALAHYGILRKSGRYPWGSGSTAETRSRTLMDDYANLRKSGMSDTDIARGWGMSTTELRAAKSIARNQIKAADISYAQRLKDKGMSNVEIGKKMGKNESSVRALLADGAQYKADQLTTISNMLRDQVDTKGYIDVGSGVENHLGISDTKLKTATAMLKGEGYEVLPVQIEQLGTGNKTTMRVLCPPGTTYKDLVTNRDKIRQIDEHSADGGNTFDLNMEPPTSVSSKRLAIRYAEEGGTDADGVIYIRPGVEDLSLGSSHYAQVRIAVDDSHYLKGMAMYKNDLPDGVDLMFNTNKSNTGNKLDALKKLKAGPDGLIDTDNPFGAVISRQNKSKTMNIVNEEGDWEKWSKSLSSQMLSKQSPTLAKQQLQMKYDMMKADFDEISSLTNPAVKEKLLQSLADNADSASVHLKAASGGR